ncbi:basic 7S globulin-like isoform X2 [Papaver somniferum]|uniref:basic 7S globulin-like isoform X2 n=1 Tax=Papaver somniferum TaxID=3469 RepID=UPI000E706029|nr:basic 7S globulin-like isoform X2 [Papaver somniferum]
MASSSLSVIQFLVVFFFVSQLPSSSSLPDGIVFKLKRDTSTLQYMIKFSQGTPKADVKLALDLGGKLPWFDCHEGYNSSSARRVKCKSSLCSLANRENTTSTCSHNSHCSIHKLNPVTQSISEGAKGVAGLGRSSALSLVFQFAIRFRFPRTFAVDLLESNVYFGGGPYVHRNFYWDHDKSRVLEYTRFLINPMSIEEYFVDLKSIKVYGKTVPIDKKLLSINKGTGVGGTKIDIQTPFTTLQTSIYKAFIKIHTEWAKSMNISMVTPVAPFTACYNSSTLPPFNGNRQTPGVTFVFPKNEWGVAWRDLVEVNEATNCVGFVDGGLKPMTSIVIGARQIGFAEFDISRSRLGFLQPNFMT